MPAISENVAGVDFANVWNATLRRVRPFKTGQTVKADDGKLYQYAKASAAISAGLATCLITVVSSEYSAAATGGTSTNASGVALATGDYAWFKL